MGDGKTRCDARVAEFHPSDSTVDDAVVNDGVDDAVGGNPNEEW
jgi:hypothetical protein